MRFKEYLAEVLNEGAHADTAINIFAKKVKSMGIKGKINRDEDNETNIFTVKSGKDEYNVYWDLGFGLDKNEKDIIIDAGKDTETEIINYLKKLK